jgi:hypothetical protein
MGLFDKRKTYYLLLGLALIIVGFIVMKLEPAEFGLGFLALTIAPILILSGYILGIKSIFPKSICIDKWKQDAPFLISGWATFFVSLTVYVLTLEETASLWDCAEFIACAYKLQVPHPPGTPLFLMIGRTFSMFALGDNMKVAFWINMSSAVSSAVSVMFVFWSVVMLGRRINSKASKFALTLSGLVGGFSIAFADSFWFSAVEAETYAMATMFLAICFWAILKWDQDENNSWLIFLMYALGLSIGVHPMTLLVLPAVALFIVFKFHEFSWKALLLATCLGGLSILFLNQVVLFGLPDVMKYADIFFVNSLRLPFYSGAITVPILIIVFGYMLYAWSIKKQRKNLSISMVGLLYFLIGYSCYFMIIIRSQANTPIDEHNPDNIISLASYLKRKSYGSRPIVYGPNFTSKIKSYKKGKAIYVKGENAYNIADYKTEYVYEKSSQTILPRMYSNEPNHIQTYREWAGLKNVQQPKFMDNFAFLIRYQIGQMYLRYLMFNFAGRESDIQHAPWLSPLDALEKVPDSMKANKARNNFFMLPLLLGILGMVFQYKKDKAGFWATMAFFLFLGAILAFYLNSPPNEPRERDYIYVGSYLAFAIWCGIGAMGICAFLEQKSLKNPWRLAAGLLIFSIPILMLIVGYDDHNRSGRTLQVDHARNTLASCASNAILFTGGDNDTFPLWYVQEVEGFRTDVRVIVLSYFNGDWYIDQMKRRVYDSDALPFSVEKKDYRQGGLNDALPFTENPNIKGAINLERYLDLVKSENKAIQVAVSNDTKYNSIPSKTFYMDIDKEKILYKNIIPKEFEPYIPNKFEIKWKGNFMGKSAFMVLDLIATNQWHRPIYFNLTSLNSIALDLKSHVLCEGQVYRLLPIELSQDRAIDIEKMYQNLINKSVYNDLDDENAYYNHEDFQLRILQNLRSNYNDLVEKLVKNHQHKKAKETVDFVYVHLHGKNKPIGITSLRTVDLLFQLHENDHAENLANQLYTQADQLLNYYHFHQELKSTNAQIQFYSLQKLQSIAAKYGQQDLAEKCRKAFDKYYEGL